MKKNRSVLFHIVFLFSILTNIVVFAEEPTDVPQKTVDPTASLPKLTLKNTYSKDFWTVDEERNITTLLVTNPFYVWDQHNLLAVSVPYTSRTGGLSGEGTTQIFDLLIFNRSWGRFGVGYDVALSAPRARVQGIQSGPALAAVAVVGKCNYGGLNLNFFGERVSMSALQIIAGCSLGNGWTVSTGDFIVTYDWRESEYLEVPISVQLGKVVDISGQKMQVFVNPTYNVQDTPGTPKWSYIVGISLVANPFNN